MEENLSKLDLPSKYQMMDTSLEVIFNSMIDQRDVSNAIDFIRSIDINFLPSRSVIQQVIFKILMKNNDVRCLALASDYLMTVLHVYPPNDKNRQFYYDAIQDTQGYLADLWNMFSHIVNSYFYHSAIYTVQQGSTSLGPIQYPNCKFLLEFYVQLFELDFENHNYESPCLMMKLLWNEDDIQEHGAAFAKFASYKQTSTYKTERLLKWINEMYGNFICLETKGDLLVEMHKLLTLMVKCMIQQSPETLDAAAFCNPKTSEIAAHIFNFCSNAFMNFKHVQMFLSNLSCKYLQARVSEKVIKENIKQSSKISVFTLRDVVDQCMFKERKRPKNYKPNVNKEKNLRRKSFDKRAVIPDTKIRTTTLHEFCRKNKFGDLYQELQRTCENVNARNDVGFTPLHEACQAGNHLCVKCLIEETNKKSFVLDLTAVNVDGDTPLHLAIKKNCTNTAEELLRAGGYELLNITNNKGYYPADLSTSDEMSKVLEDHQSETNTFEFETKEVSFETPVYKNFTQCSIHLHALNCLLCSYCDIFNLYEFLWKKNTCVLSHKDQKCCHYEYQYVCSEDEVLIQEMEDLVKTFIESVCKRNKELNIDIELVPLKAFAASLKIGTVVSSAI